MARVYENKLGLTFDVSILLKTPTLLRHVVVVVVGVTVERGHCHLHREFNKNK